MGCVDFTDADGNFWPYKVAHVGPRVSGANEFFPVKFEMVSRFDVPYVYVDGNITYREFVEVDRVDPTMKPDRMLISVTNSVLGITMTRKIMQFSHPYHDNYIIVEFTFENTGNVDDDDEIELDDLDFEDYDADAYVRARFEQDDVEYEAVFRVEIKDNEIDDITLESVELRD